MVDPAPRFRSLPLPVLVLVLAAYVLLRCYDQLCRSRSHQRVADVRLSRQHILARACRLRHVEGRVAILGLTGIDPAWANLIDHTAIAWSRVAHDERNRQPLVSRVCIDDFHLGGLVATHRVRRSAERELQLNAVNCERRRRHARIAGRIGRGDRDRMRADANDSAGERALCDRYWSTVVTRCRQRNDVGDRCVTSAICVDAGWRRHGYCRGGVVDDRDGLSRC